jgi:hypothetical protein
MSRKRRRPQRRGHGRAVAVVTAAEVAAETGLSTAEVQRSIRHLEHHHWMRQIGPDAYELGQGHDCPGPALCPEWQP